MNNRTTVATGWTNIAWADLPAWNERLDTTQAHYRQYPYWCASHKLEGIFIPRFYSFNTESGVVAYVCILEGSVAGVKFGLIFRGPVAVGDELLSDNVMQELLNLAKDMGYAFLRISHQSKAIFEQLSSFENVLHRESFPFYRDPPKALIVEQADTDASMLRNFQSIARRNIRAGEKAGFVICRSDSPDEYREMWPMFERLAKKKGFDLTDRSLDAWLDVIEAAREHGCSVLYTASLNGVCVSAIHLLRYGSTVEFMLGALDLELLGENPSPSALLHWTAMRDQYRSGCKYYNFGGPGDGITNKVYQFKRKFRPELRTAQPPVTVVLNPFAFAIWDLVVLKGWLGLSRQVRRVRGKGRTFYHRTREKLVGAN